MTHGALDWYTARAAGIVAYVLLTAVVLLGLTLSGRVQLKAWPKFALTDVHRFAGLLVGVFVALHVLTIGLDTYTRFSLTQLLVPFASTYRPVWVALGVVAAELLVALAITNLLRSRIPYRSWRRAHYVAFLVWAGATGHGIGAGTDSSSLWLASVYVAAVGAVLAALAWRIGRRRLGAVPGAPLAALAAALGVAAVVGLGALPHGGRPKARIAAKAPPARVSESFTGSISQQQGAAGALVSVVGRGSGSRALAVRIDLVTPDGNAITSTSLQLLDRSSGALCTGSVTTIDAHGFRGACSFARGARRTVVGSWQLLGQNAVSGEVRLSS